MTEKIIEELDDELYKMFNLSKKKKHKKDKDIKNKNEDIEEKIEETNMLLDIPTYTYHTLLEHIYNLMSFHEKKETNNKITAPFVSRLSSKKTVWSNFNECCLSINRDKEHIKNYIICELGTEGSIDGNQYFILKGNYNQKHIENLLRKYISLYVQCSLCRCINTYVKRDQTSRLNFLVCNECKGTRTVQNTNSGFHVTTRAERRKERE